MSEAARVLKPGGGRFAVSDVVADLGIDEAARANMAAWIGCIAGALTRDECEQHLTEAGLRDVEITETHRVHEQAAPAIIRARKLDGEECCSVTALETCCEPAAKTSCCGSETAATAPSSCGYSS